MIERSLLTNALLVALLVTASPVYADVPDPSSGITAQLNKAAFWDQHNKPEMAFEYYKRVLESFSNNIEALIGAARITLDKGETVAAKSYIERIRALAPNDPHLADLELLQDRTKGQIAILAEARTLATSGKRDSAVAQYRRLISKGIVPDDIALEYYPLLIASLPPDSVEANDALVILNKLAAKSPDNNEIQLIDAHALVALEGSRSEGIEKLRHLAALPSVGPRARVAWRETLLWQGADSKSQIQLEDYLRDNPTDPQIEAKRKEYHAALDSETQARIRIRGYEAIRTKHFDIANKEFQVALQQNPDDVEALIMMAAIRQQQGKAAESKKYLLHALELAPDRRQELLAIVGADQTANARYAQIGARNSVAPYNEVIRLTKTGNYEQAEKNLLRIMGSHPKIGILLQLADIQVRSGRLDAASSSLRRIIALDPGNSAATLTLSALLMRQGRPDEAALVINQAEAALSHAGNTTALQAMRQIRAQTLYQEAHNQHTPLGQQTNLRAALALDPSNAWIRLDFAQSLQNSQDRAEVEATMAALPTSGANSQDIFQVEFLWLQSQGDFENAAKWALRISPATRTALMRSVIDQASARADIYNALQRNDPKGSRERLLKLAAVSDSTGGRASEIGRIFLRVGDTDAMESALTAGLAHTRIPTETQRITYASMLLQDHRYVAARRMIDNLKPDRLTPELRQSLINEKANIAVIEADFLVKKGKISEALEALISGLRENPDDLNLNLSLIRFYQSNKDYKTALTISMRIMKQNPSESTARFAAIDAAEASGDRSLAKQLMVEGQALFPKNSSLLMQAAFIAQSHGNNATALDYMLKARVLRMAEISNAQPR